MNLLLCNYVEQVLWQYLHQSLSTSIPNGLLSIISFTTNRVEFMKTHLWWSITTMSIKVRIPLQCKQLTAFLSSYQTGHWSNEHSICFLVCLFVPPILYVALSIMCHTWYLSTWYSCDHLLKDWYFIMHQTP